MLEEGEAIDLKLSLGSGGGNNKNISSSSSIDHYCRTNALQPPPPPPVDNQLHALFPTRRRRRRRPKEEEEKHGTTSEHLQLYSIINNDGSGSRSRTPDENSPERDGGGGGTSRKKLRLSKEQSSLLEDSFRQHHTLNPIEKRDLAQRLNLLPRQVEVWFQNRRARTKMKKTEVDKEYLKRCCESLSHENRRLREELRDLRLTKLGWSVPCLQPPPDAVMPMGMTLALCPSCEKATKESVTDGGLVTVAVKPKFCDHRVAMKDTSICDLL